MSTIRIEPPINDVDHEPRTLLTGLKVKAHLLNTFKFQVSLHGGEVKSSILHVDEAKVEYYQCNILMVAENIHQFFIAFRPTCYMEIHDPNHPNNESTLSKVVKHILKVWNQLMKRSTEQPVMHMSGVKEQQQLAASPLAQASSSLINP